MNEYYKIFMLFVFYFYILQKKSFYKKQRHPTTILVIIVVCPYFCIILLSLQYGDGQSSHYDAYHRHQLDEDVERRTGGVLEGVAYGVAYDGGLVVVAALAFEVAFFYHLLGVVPCSAGVGHEDGEGEAGGQATSEQTEDAGYAEHQAYYDGDDDGEERGDDHLTLGAAGAYLHTTTIVGRGLAFKDALYLAELTAHFLHHRFGCTSYGAHCQAAEKEGCHRTEEGADEHLGIDEVHLEEVDEVNGGGIGRVEEVAGSVNVLLAVLHGSYHGYLYLLDVGSEEGESREGCRTDGEALTSGCGGVAESVEGVCALTHFLAQSAHLRIASSVVGDGTVSVGGKCDAECGEHADGCDADAVKSGADRLCRERHVESVGAEITEHDGYGDGHHRYHRGNHTRADALDDDRGRSGLRSLGNFLRRLIAV